MRVSGTPLRYWTSLAVMHLATVMVAVQPALAVEPTPTPTPVRAHPSPRGREARYLGDIAGRTVLNTSAAEIQDGAIVITNESVARHAGERSSAAGTSDSWAADQARRQEERSRLAERARRQQESRRFWRKRYLAQRERVDKVRSELAMLDVKIDNLAERQRMSSARQRLSVNAKLQESRRKRQLVKQRLDQEQAKLDSIIRQARLEGAQPGWFR